MPDQARNPDVDDLQRQIAALTEENRALRERTAAPAEIVRFDEFEALFDLLPVGIAMACDPACEQMRTNAAFNRMLGLPARQNASKTGPTANSLPFRVFRDGQEVNPEDLPMQIAARTGVSVDGSRCEIRRDDGHVLAMYGTVRPLFDAQGQTRGSIGVFIDATERELLIQELREAMTHVRMLKGLLRICASCKKICDGDGSWLQMEAFLRNHSEAEFTHTYCPLCLEKVLADI